MTDSFIHTDSYLSDYRILSEGASGPIVIYISSKSFTCETPKLYELVQLMAGIPFIFCELIVEDWDRLLTPWPVDQCLKNRTFYGEGNTLLAEIEQTLIPELNIRYPGHKEVYLAGYSLAGLFALWALYESNLPDGAVCCSGSLWYPGWTDYAKQKKLSKPASIYLSLGKKEEQTRHPVMQKVGEATRLQYDLLRRGTVCQEVFAIFSKLNF